jgi:glucose-6-phosphate 1-dehydrogenase
MSLSFVSNINLKLNTKMSGLHNRSVGKMDLIHNTRFEDTKISDAYEALLLDALKRDHSNFVRDDELDAAWKVTSLEYRLLADTHYNQIFTPIICRIDGRNVPPASYPYGS